MVIYPNTHQKHPDHTWSVILINTNLITDLWKQIHFEHPDITAIEIQESFRMLQILNIYNDCNNNSSLTHVSTYMQDKDKHQCTNMPLLTAWMGDFN
jgi:hypothetical protein